jgi:hypothetical protein
MTDDDSDASGGVPPKLTIAQRVLTALPSLQREPRAPAPPPPATTKTSPATGRAAPARDRSGPPRTRAGGTQGLPDDSADDRADDRDGVDGVDGADDDAGEEGGDGSVVTEDGGSTSRAGPGGMRGRPRDDLDTMTREEITHRIKRLDDRERFLALSSAPLGAAVGIGLTILAIHLNPPLLLHGKLNAKHESNSLILLEGGARILLSGIVVAAALSRRRSLVGFALLFLGTAMGSPLFALPFWVLGGYLIWRVFKYQRVLTARGGAQARPARQARAPGGRRVPANPREASRAGVSAARDRAQSRRTKKQPAPTGPPPSKRYTPPRPTRPRPPAPPS